MAGYNSKFTGQQVDSLLEKAGSSYQKPETGIPQSDLDESTQQILQNVDNKVNKEEGKGLSTNDFTDEYKAKVEDSASQEGYFPKMSVGIAANLAGRGEATEQVFTYRPTDGGTSIESGVAKIRRVKGNSVVWNQLIDYTKIWVRNTGIPELIENSTFTQDGADFDFLITTDSSTPYRIWLQNPTTPNWIEGHKYLILSNLRGNINETPNPLRYLGGGFNIAAPYSNEEYGSIIVEPTKNSTHPFALIQATETIIPAGTYLKGHISVFDLTQMFGVGNEPDTIEEFRALYPDSYYPYNTGELRNLVCSGIKTVGFNQWDEQWEYGNIDSYTGVTTALSNCIRSTNFIPVIGGKSYYFSKKDGAEIGLYAYDDTYNFIGVYDNDDFAPSARTTKVTNKSIQLPTNAKYIKFRVYPYTTSTSVNDICINLHHTGWRDGDYEPYKEVTHSLPLSNITNGEPLRKAGSVYDEINETHYIKRVGVVDLGSLEWVYYSSDAYFKTYGLNGNASAFNFFCSRYTVSEKPFAGLPDKTIRSTSSHFPLLVIKDSAFTTDAATFKASLSGVMLNYELAEPIVTPIETPLNLDYQAEDFGTEEALLTDNSAPFSADIVYQFNAVDRIRENSLDIEDLLARVIALENAAATTASIPDIPDITE